MLNERTSTYKEREMRAFQQTSIIYQSQTFSRIIDIVVKENDRNSDAGFTTFEFEAQHV